MIWTKFFRRPPVFRAVAEEYLGISLAKCCNEYQRYTRYRMDHWVYPTIGSKRINKIKPPEILACIQEFEKGAPSQARRLLQVLSGVFKYAKVQGWCDHNPADGLGIALKPYSYKGFKHISIKQMPDFLADVDARVTLDAAAVTAFWLIAYTAVRRGEAVNADLSEFDFSDGLWTIPAERMKMKRPHLVPLAAPVVNLLEEWLEERNRIGIVGNKLFGGIGGHRPLHVITQAGWRGRMTIHGFRKVFSTAAHESGLWNIDAIELQLAHIIPGVRGVYNKAAMLEERRRLMDWYAEQVHNWRGTVARL
ncbi:tyrosine-type recombinase/integrase [Neisseria sp.]|uniref:tyrosine-type recombinase/integrase n=1 Tax=Neisseria sp. TaxID=192066 RepID=UPI0035A13632